MIANFMSQPLGLVTIGIILIIIDILILGWSTLFFTFFGCGCLVVAGLAYFDWEYVVTIPQKLMWISSIAVLLGVLFWRVVKRKSSSDPEPSNGLVGVTFVLSDDVSANTESFTRFSGVIWKVKSKYDIKMGSTVMINKCEVGRLFIEPADDCDE